MFSAASAAPASRACRSPRGVNSRSSSGLESWGTASPCRSSHSWRAIARAAYCCAPPSGGAQHQLGLGEAPVALGPVRILGGVAAAAELRRVLDLPAREGGAQRVAAVGEIFDPEHPPAAERPLEANDRELHVAAVEGVGVDHGAKGEPRAVDDLAAEEVPACPAVANQCPHALKDRAWGPRRLPGQDPIRSSAPPNGEH